MSLEHMFSGMVHDLVPDFSPHYHDHNKHPNESLFLDQNKNPFHDMDHTAFAGTTLDFSPPYHDHNKHPNESLFRDQNKNPFHDMDHTAIAGTTLVGGASLAIGGPILLRGLSGNGSGATNMKKEEQARKVKEKEERAKKEEQARKVKEKEEKARNMQYYYWRQYGNNAICLFKTTKTTDGMEKCGLMTMPSIGTTKAILTRRKHFV